MRRLTHWQSRAVDYLGRIMIKYALKCEHDHSFESWFASADAHEQLAQAGHLACPVCGTSAVRKAMMAPVVSSSQGAEAPAPDVAEREAALAKLRAEVEANATYVGGAFATEARAQHLGDVPEKPIWGEARPEEARALLEDGIPVMPLPFVPTRKAN